jgi:hypothetical protein
VLCLICHRSFDGVAAIDDSNQYIKRLNNIEIDKKKMRYFGPLSHNFPLPPLFQTTNYGPELDLKLFLQSVPRP